MRWNYSNGHGGRLPSKFSFFRMRYMTPVFEIGNTVTFIDKDKPRNPPQRGRIVGIDPAPPERTKRKGPCYLLKLANQEEWVYRIEEELLEIEELS